MKRVRTADRNFDFVVRNAQRLQNRYAGRWIGVANGKVVAVGRKATEIVRKTKDKYEPEEVLLHAVDRYPLGIYRFLPVNSLRTGTSGASVELRPAIDG